MAGGGGGEAAGRPAEPEPKAGAAVPKETDSGPSVEAAPSASTAEAASKASTDPNAGGKAGGGGSEPAGGGKVKVFSSYKAVKYCRIVGRLNLAPAYPDMGTEPAATGAEHWSEEESGRAGRAGWVERVLGRARSLSHPRSPGIPPRATAPPVVASGCPAVRGAYKGFLIKGSV